MVNILLASALIFALAVITDESDCRLGAICRRVVAIFCSCVILSIGFSNGDFFIGLNYDTTYTVICGLAFSISLATYLGVYFLRRPSLPWFAD